MFAKRPREDSTTQGKTIAHARSMHVKAVCIGRVGKANEVDVRVSAKNEAKIPGAF